MSGSDYFLKKALGEDFFESLQKFELWKPGTKTTVDHEEIKTALMIVPRTLMSFLVYHLSNMKVGENKEIHIPIQADCVLRITKHERDVYSGDVLENNKKAVDFKYRTIPGVGLVIMSAFELYETEKLANPPQPAEGRAEIEDKIEKLIEERLALRDLIGNVVDKKIEEREAVKKLFLARLTEELHAQKEVKEEPKQEIHIENAIIINKGSPLKDFLDKRKKKKNEFSIQMTKGEVVDCPDCGKDIFSSEGYSGCICFGSDMDKKVFIKKSEDGIKVRFGKGWDTDNIEMLLELLRKKRE